MSRPKRHHFVPRAYLARFAFGDSVLVRQRDSKIFRANPVNVAVECGFYDLADGSGKRSSRIEEVLAGVDGTAIAAMRSIDRTDEPPSAGTDERLALAVFLALQNTRTPEQRERILFPERVADYARDRELTKELMAEFLEHVHLGFRPSANETSAAFDYVSVALGEPRAQTSGFAIEMMLRSVDQVAPVLATMNWTLEFDRKEQLITSDLPIVIWRAPSPRDKYEGVGVANADELRFPLDPGKQLVLSKRSRTPTVRITAERARACNTDTAAACHRFIVGSPNRPTLIEAPHMAERRPVVRFNTGPLYERQPDGTTEYQGEVLHMWVPRR
jgi:uncharacterized protein DUF4238